MNKSGVSKRVSIAKKNDRKIFDFANFEQYIPKNYEIYNKYKTKKGPFVEMKPINQSKTNLKDIYSIREQRMGQYLPSERFMGYLLKELLPKGCKTDLEEIKIHKNIKKENYSESIFSYVCSEPINCNCEGKRKNIEKVISSGDSIYLISKNFLGDHNEKDFFKWLHKMKDIGTIEK